MEKTCPICQLKNVHHVSPIRSDIGFSILYCSCCDSVVDARDISRVDAPLEITETVRQIMINTLSPYVSTNPELASKKLAHYIDLAIRLSNHKDAIKDMGL